MDLDGESLLPLLREETTIWKDEAFSEDLAHGTDRLRAMIRQGRWKLCYSHGKPTDIEPYDLEEDPGEFENLAGLPPNIDIETRLLARIMDIWGDPEALRRRLSLTGKRDYSSEKCWGTKLFFRSYPFTVRVS